MSNKIDRVKNNEEVGTYLHKKCQESLLKHRFNQNNYLRKL